MEYKYSVFCFICVVLFFATLLYKLYLLSLFLFILSAIFYLLHIINTISTKGILLYLKKKNSSIYCYECNSKLKLSLAATRENYTVCYIVVCECEKCKQIYYGYDSKYHNN